jgi:hypothetical protein
VRDKVGAMSPPKRTPLPALLAFAALAFSCASEPPPPPRVVAPPEATTIVMPPPKDLSICQRSAKPTTGGDATTIGSFEGFSRDWIGKMRTIATARASTAGPKQIRDVYEMELRPTGSAQAPYVGILTYCEVALHCSGAGQTSCKPSSSTVVRELFRYQAGQWVY